MSLCLIGKIVAVQGLRGALKVFSYSDIPGRFTALKTVLVGTDEQSVEEMRVREATEQPNRVLLFLEDCNTRDDAESFVGEYLFVQENEMCSPPEGMYFIHDLIGCAVVSTTGETRGIVKDVIAYPANNVYVIDYKGRDVLFPAVPEFIREVHLAEKTIIVHIIPGFFEDDDEN